MTSITNTGLNPNQWIYFYLESGDLPKDLGLDPIFSFTPTRFFYVVSKENNAPDSSVYTLIDTEANRWLYDPKKEEFTFRDHLPFSLSDCWVVASKAEEEDVVSKKGTILVSLIKEIAAKILSPEAIALETTPQNAEATQLAEAAYENLASNFLQGNHAVILKNARDTLVTTFYHKPESAEYFASSLHELQQADLLKANQAALLKILTENPDQLSSFATGLRRLRRENILTQEFFEIFIKSFHAALAEENQNLLPRTIDNMTGLTAKKAFRLKRNIEKLELPLDLPIFLDSASEESEKHPKNPSKAV